MSLHVIAQLPVPPPARPRGSLRVVGRVPEAELRGLWGRSRGAAFVLREPLQSLLDAEAGGGVRSGRFACHLLKPCFDATRLRDEAALLFLRDQVAP